MKVSQGMKHSHLTDGLRLQTEMLQRGDIFTVKDVVYRVVHVDPQLLYYVPVHMTDRRANDKWTLPRSLKDKVEVNAVMIACIRRNEAL